MVKSNDEVMGYYEKRLCLLMFLSSIPNTFITIQVLVTQFTPNHHCDTKEVFEFFKARNVSNASSYALNISIPMEENEFGEMSRSKCKQYNYTQLLAAGYHQDTFNVSIISCKSIHYEGPESSAVTEFDLVCDRAWLNPFFTSCVYIGMTLASFVAGSLSDRYGRKPVFLAFTFWSFISVFLQSFMVDEISYGVLCVLVGIGNLINYAVAAVMGSETISARHRTFVYFSLTMGYSFGYLLMSPLSYFFRDWRWFLRFSGLVGILYIPYIWLIDESPRWLLASGKSEKAQKVLDKIGTLNGRTPTALKDLNRSESDVPIGVWKTFVQIGREPILVSRFFIGCLAWGVISMVYFQIALNNNNLSGNRFLNLFYSSVVEIASAFMYYIFVSKWGRCFPFIITSVGLAFSIVATSLMIKWSSIFVIISTMIGKLMVATAWAVLYVHTLEVFPTKTRQSILFWLVVSSRVGGIIAPFIIHTGESGNVLTPAFVISGLLIVTTLLYTFLPETSNKSLPQTVEDAKSLEGVWKQYWMKITCSNVKAQKETYMEEYNKVLPFEQNI